MQDFKIIREYMSKLNDHILLVENTMTSLVEQVVQTQHEINALKNAIREIDPDHIILCEGEE